MKVSFDYLDALIDSCYNMKNNFEKAEICEDKLSSVYMPTKKQSFIGIKCGFFELYRRQNYAIKESEKLRSNCRDYNRISKNADGKVISIDSFVNGRLDCYFHAFYLNETRYLFPYSSTGGFYPTYSYVTKFEGRLVSEEYMVNGNQIVYEKYFDETPSEVNYYRINYVRGGTYKILEQEEGVFQKNPLIYRCLSSDSWLNHRN